MGGGEYEDIPSKISCLTVSPVGEPLSISLTAGIGKIYALRVLCDDFPSKVFCLKVPKNAVGEPFSLSLISGIQKICASKGYVTIFYRNFFVSQYRNIS